MSKILIDTNCYTSYLSGNHDVLDALADADMVLMSIFVLGELYAGFKGGNKEKENITILRKFLNKPTVSTLGASKDTAEIFGMVKNSLKVAGTPIPINDVWIAAHTLETGSIIITYDKHFNQVPGLRVWDK